MNDEIATGYTRTCDCCKDWFYTKDKDENICDSCKQQKILYGSKKEEPKVKEFDDVIFEDDLNPEVAKEVWKITCRIADTIINTIKPTADKQKMANVKLLWPGIVHLLKNGIYDALNAREIITKIKRDKNEEIKQMAWEIYKLMRILVDKKFSDSNIDREEMEDDILIFKHAWERAEKFYNYAKEKEEGANET